MAIIKSQDSPASSFSDTVSTPARILTALSDAFQAARDWVAPPPAPYRERLCASDRIMFDRFYALKASRPDHQVFVGIAHKCEPDVFKSYATLEEAQADVKAMGENKYGPKPFIAFDLQKDFHEQWLEEPDGRDFSTSLKTKAPISKVNELVLPVNHLKL